MLTKPFPAAPPGLYGWPWEPPDDTPYSTTQQPPWPRITIVTPSYNQGDYLEATIRSVLLQNYPNLEYILIDAASTDNTPQIIEKYAGYFSYWISEPDEGQAHAINKGIRRSTGEIIGWLNSDDLLLPGALFTIAQTFMDDPAAMIVTGFRKVYDAEGNFRRNYFDAPPTERVLRVKCTIAQEATYWRREVTVRIGYLDESLQYALDFEYWQRMLDAGYEFKLLPQYIGGFRTHGASKGENMAAVREAELARIYAKRGIAHSEEEAFESLKWRIGRNWPGQHELIQTLCRHEISDDPRNLLWAYRLMQVPGLSRLITGLHGAYVNTRHTLKNHG